MSTQPTHGNQLIYPFTGCLGALGNLALGCRVGNYFLASEHYVKTSLGWEVVGFYTDTKDSF